MDGEDETAVAVRFLGWRFAPLAALVLVAGSAVCWKLIDSGAVFETVALRGQPPAASVVVRRDPEPEAVAVEQRKAVDAVVAPDRPRAADVDADADAAQSVPDGTGRREQTPVAASIAPSVGAPVTLVDGPRLGERADDLQVIDIASLRPDGSRLEIAPVEGGGATITEAGAISSVEALLAAANSIVGGGLEDPASGSDSGGSIDPVGTSDDTPSRSPSPPTPRFEVVVITPEEILRASGDGGSKVRKTNHESLVTSWNTMSREMADAIDGGAVTRVRDLVAEGEDINASDIQGETPLIKAAWNSDAAMVSTLLELGADVFLASNNGRTALYTGVVSGDLEVVRLLLEAGAPTNVTTDFGKTPLMASAWSDFPEIALMLLRYGAEPNQLDNRGRGALFYALWDRNEFVARLLAANGADLDITDYLGQSAADIARLRRIDINRHQPAGPVVN